MTPLDPVQHLEDVLLVKRRNLLTTRWEVAFAKEHHRDLLQEGALMAARTTLSKARADQEDPDRISELNQNVEDIKDTRKQVARLEVTITDLEAQIAYLDTVVRGSLAGKETAV